MSGVESLTQFRRREQLRRAAEDGERLYRKLMHVGELTVADDHRLHGILTRELENALGLVDELLEPRACLVCRGLGVIDGFWLGTVKTCPACHGEARARV